MVAVPAKVQSRTFQTSSEYQAWTEDVIKWAHATIREVEEAAEKNLKEMVLEIEGAQAILKGALSSLPTVSEGNMVTNYVGSKRSSSAISTKLSRAADDLMTASRQHRRVSDSVRASASKVREAFALFERDYLGFVALTGPAKNKGMKIDHKRPGTRTRSSSGSSNGRQPAQAQTTP